MKHPITNEELAFLVEIAMKSGLSKKDFKVFIQSKKFEKEIKSYVNSKVTSLLK